MDSTRGGLESGLSKRADERNRSVRVRGLPPATQEGLLHQTFEKLAPIKRVEVFQIKREAVVELQSVAVCFPSTAWLDWAAHNTAV